MTANKTLSLAVDTSHSRGQMILFSKEKIIGAVDWDKKGSHSERITDHFDLLLKQKKRNISELNKLFCVTGPGSFTGLRVGVNFIKALSYSFNIPIQPINSLYLLAMNGLNKQGSIVSIIDAQKNSLFVSEYKSNGSCLTPVFENQIYQLKSLDKIFTTPKFVYGQGLKRYQSFLSKNYLKNIITQDDWCWPDLKKLSSQNQWTYEPEKKWFELQPFYIKNSAAEEKVSPTKEH